MTADVAGLQRAATATLDKLNRGVLLLQSDGRVAYINRAAKAMLARPSGLYLHDGRFGFQARAAQMRLETYLGRHHDNDVITSLMLTVDGPEQRDCYRVLVSLLELVAEGPSYCVFIYEPDAGRRELPTPVLAELYGLTPSEARLTNELFLGKTLTDAADCAGITISTARSMLKKIFGKCSVRSQAALLQLLSLGPRTL
jgi:DNA-binding CsgD family transcriptional regulator